MNGGEPPFLGGRGLCGSWFRLNVELGAFWLSGPWVHCGGVQAEAPDKAAIRVSFDALPQEAERFVLVAAVDPVVNPDADLSGFTDAFIRLPDPARTELGRLEVLDGRAGETALVLGSFRHRPSGDWDFVLGGKGYTRVLNRLSRSTASKWSSGAGGAQRSDARCNRDRVLDAARVSDS